MRTGYAIRRPVANTYLVRERDRRRWRELGLVLLFVVPVGVALLTYASVHLRVLELGLEITALERRLDEARDEQSRLRREAAALADPARVEVEAREQLGLERPTTARVLYAQEQH